MLLFLTGRLQFSIRHRHQVVPATRRLVLVTRHRRRPGSRHATGAHNTTGILRRRVHAWGCSRHLGFLINDKHLTSPKVGSHILKKNPKLAHMTDLERRTRALRLFMKHVGDNAWQLEAATALYCESTETDYEAKVRQLAWNVQQAPDLLQRYSPPTLVHLDDATLAKGTPIEQWQRAHDDNMQYQYVLLHEEHKIDAAGTLMCNRCHSHDVQVEQKQTRSADEGMTIFCECRKCGLRWKM